MKYFITTTTLMAAVLCGAVRSAVIPVTATTSKATHAPTTPFHPAATTENPRWSTPPPIKDEKLTHLANATAVLLNHTTAIYAEFELQGPLGSELHQLVDSIKKTEVEAARVSVQIKQELLANTLNADMLFSRRLSLQLLELEVKGIGRLLTEMGDLVLGIQGGVDRWPQYEISETLGSAFAVINTRLTTAIIAMAEVDIALRGQLSDLKVVDPKTRAKVDGHLVTLATTVEGLRVEASKTLAEEETRLRLEGKVVSVWQRFQFEGIIDAFTYMVTYTKHFKELFDRVNGGGS